MDRLRVLVLVSAAVASIGSGASRTSYQAETVEAPAGVEDQDLYAGAVRVLGDMGYSIREKDNDAGIVVTEWVIVDNQEFVKTRLEHAWRISITEGELRISIDCEWQSRDGRTKCENAERVETFTAKEPELRRLILDEAQRRAAKRKSKGSAATVPPKPATFAASGVMSMNAPDGANDDDLYAAIVRVLADTGRPHEKDKDAGVVTTKHEMVEQSTAGDATWTHGMRIFIREGRVTITVECAEISNYGRISPCGTNDRNARYIDGVKEFMKSVFKEAQLSAEKRKTKAAEPGKGDAE